jgi:hypothetical protein
MTDDRGQMTESRGHRAECRGKALGSYEGANERSSGLKVDMAAKKRKKYKK